MGLIRSLGHGVWKLQKKSHCERSELRIFWVDKSTSKMPKIIHLASFRKTEATTQTVLPDIQFHLRIRIVEKCQNGDFAAAFCVNLEGKCNIIMRNFSHKAKDIFLMCWPLVKKAFVFHLSYALNHSARFLSPLLNSLLLCKYPHSKEWASFCGEEKSDNWPLHCHISRLGTLGPSCN